MKALFFCVLASALVSPFSYAGVFFEPFVGHSISGQIEQSGEEIDSSGLSFGAALGWSFSNYGLGIEYGKGDYTRETTPEDTDIDRQNLAFFLIYKSDSNLVFKGSYISDSQNEHSSGVTEFGTGFHFGIGYRFLRHLSVSINFEKITYDDCTASSGACELIGDIEEEQYLIGISFPFGY